MFPGLQMTPLEIDTDVNLSIDVRTVIPGLEAAEAPMVIPLITRENGDAFMVAPNEAMTMNDAVNLTILKSNIKSV